MKNKFESIREVSEQLNAKFLDGWDFEGLKPLKRKRLGGPDSPWMAIPNIRDFKIELRPYEFLLQFFCIN